MYTLRHLLGDRLASLLYFMPTHGEFVIDYDGVLRRLKSDQLYDAALLYPYLDEEFHAYETPDVQFWTATHVGTACYTDRELAYITWLPRNPPEIKQ